MRHCLTQELEDVVIVDGVVHEAPGAPRADQSHAAKQPQLMRDRGLADPDERGDVADAELAGRERVENSHARGIAERAERVRQSLDGSRRQQTLSSRGRAPGVQVFGVAVVSVLYGLDPGESFFR